jgi:hypothetical protein
MHCRVLALLSNVPPLQAFYRRIPCVQSGGRPTVSCIPDAVNDGSDTVIDGWPRLAWRWTPHKVQAVDILHHLARVLWLVSLAT